MDRFGGDSKLANYQTLALAYRSKRHMSSAAISTIATKPFFVLSTLTGNYLVADYSFLLYIQDYTEIPRDTTQPSSCYWLGGLVGNGTSGDHTSNITGKQTILDNVL